MSYILFFCLTYTDANLINYEKKCQTVKYLNLDSCRAIEKALRSAGMKAYCIPK